jgi:hypothetical protein
MVEVSDNSAIGGDLQLEQGGASTISSTHVHGDLQWSEKDGSLAAQRSRLTGNFQADQNRGGLTISDNWICGDLECEQNTPAPTTVDNWVSGDHSGQCAAAAGRQAMHRPVTRRPTPHPQARPVHARPRCAGDSVFDDPSDDQCDGGGDD